MDHQVTSGCHPHPHLQPRPHPEPHISYLISHISKPSSSFDLLYNFLYILHKSTATYCHIMAWEYLFSTHIVSKTSLYHSSLTYHRHLTSIPLDTSWVIISTSKTYSTSISTSATMEEYSPDSFANRDSPIPLIRFDDQPSVSHHEQDVEPTTKQGKEQSMRSRLGDKARQMAGRATEKGASMQDRLLEKYISPNYHKAFSDIHTHHA